MDLICFLFTSYHDLKWPDRLKVIAKKPMNRSQAETSRKGEEGPNLSNMMPPAREYKVHPRFENK